MLHQEISTDLAQTTQDRIACTGKVVLKTTMHQDENRADRPGACAAAQDKSADAIVIFTATVAEIITMISVLHVAV